VRVMQIYETSEIPLKTRNQGQQYKEKVMKPPSRGFDTQEGDDYCHGGFWTN